MTRDEHLAWCKQRALQILEGGDRVGAITSMMSDLQKWGKPLYEPQTFVVLIMAGRFETTDAGVRHWIEGFN